jgi:hypothetical protein
LKAPLKDGTVKAHSPPVPLGFRAQLQGMSLWDLVQLECLARSHIIVQVTGESGAGHLYFDRGRIVHAVTANLVGEDAALEILSWNNGSFQSCDLPWPEAATIASSHEALILQAATRRDEARGSNLVAFPARPDTAVSDDEAFEEIELIEIHEEGTSHMRTSNIDEKLPVPPVTRSELGGDFPVVLRLRPNGTIISNRGGSEELAETVAYAQRLVQLTGDLLGLDEFSALECTFTQGRCLMFMENNGDIVALRPRPDANLQPLREKLGL